MQININGKESSETESTTSNLKNDTSKTKKSKSEYQKCTILGETVSDSNDCGSYYVCLNDSCGNIHPVAQTCIAFESNYDPVKRVCASQSVSGCLAELLEPDCQIGDSSVADPSDARRYYLCIQTVQTKLVKMHRFCPPNLVFNDDRKLCICNETVSKSCNMSLSNPDDENTDCLDESELEDPPFYADFLCQKQGVFADGYDCTRYYVCKLEKCGKMVKYGLNCPKNMKFNAKTKECCTDPDTKCVCSCRDDSFTCNYPGLFPDVSCPSQFYECYIDNFIVFKKKRVACPDGTFYNPKCQACTDSPQDKCDFSESSEEHEDSSRYSVESIATDGLCKGMKSRYPVKGEPDCYYRCKDGALTKEKCPENCIFDRLKKYCRPATKTDKKNCQKQIKFNINVGKLDHIA